MSRVLISLLILAIFGYCQAAVTTGAPPVSSGTFTYAPTPTPAPDASRCVGNTVIKAQDGSFSDHEGPGSYIANQECSWLIEMPDGSSVSYVNFRFSKLDTEPYFDYVRVYAGNSTTAPLVKTFSGLASDYDEFFTVFYTTGIYVTFSADGTVQRGGFALDFSAVTCAGGSDSGCGDSGYCFNDACVCEEDRSGAACEIAICPTTCLPPNGTCVNDECECTFGMFGLDCRSRFCDGLKVLRAQEGMFTDNSNDERYNADSSCQWLIAPEPPVPSTSTLVVYFSKFDVEGGYDYVRLYDGNSTSAPLIATLTGDGDFGERRVVNERFASLSGRVLVTFDSDDFVNYDGFTGHYEIVTCTDNCNGHGVCLGDAEVECSCDHGYTGPTCAVSECFLNCNGHGQCVDDGDGSSHCQCSGGWTEAWCGECVDASCLANVGYCQASSGSDDYVELVEASGTLGTSNVTAQHRMNTTCRWRISPARPVDDKDGSGRVDSITIDFDDDFGLVYGQGEVVIYHGFDEYEAPDAGPYHGTRSPRQVHILASDVTVVFRHSGSQSGVGFSLSYEAHQCASDCGDSGSCIDGTCDCGIGFTGPHCNQTVCVGDCSMRGSCVQSAQYGELCGCFPGYFDADCDSTHCEERKIVVNSTGLIQDRADGAGSTYLTGSNCEWRIVPQEHPDSAAGSTVSLVFRDFGTELGFDTVTVYAVTRNGTERELGEFSGQVAPPPVVTDVNETLRVVFRSDFSSQYKGFKAAFADSRHCRDHCLFRGACVPPVNGTSDFTCACKDGYAGVSCEEVNEPTAIVANADGSFSPVSGESPLLQWKYYTVEVGFVDGQLPGRLRVNVTTELGNDNDTAVDVFLKFGAPPGASDNADAETSRNVAYKVVEAKLPQNGTWYIGIYGRDEGNYSVQVSMECAACHYGTCQRGSCVCEPGASGVDCGVRRTASSYMSRSCVSSDEYSDYCVDVELTQCSFDVNLYNTDRSVDVTRHFNSTSGSGVEVCALLGNDIFSTDTCARISGMSVDAGGASGCISFGVYFIFFDLYSEDLHCFVNAPFRGNCSGCPNQCSGSGDCVFSSPEDTSGECRCLPGYGGDDCSEEPDDQFYQCQYSSGGADGVTLPDSICVRGNLAACPPTLSLQLDDNAVNRTVPMNFDRGEETVAIINAYRGCTYTLRSPAPQFSPGFKVSSTLIFEAQCGTADLYTIELQRYSLKSLNQECTETGAICGDNRCDAPLETLENCFYDCRCANAPRPQLAHDGWCDAENNVDCCYDGGDCCEETCVDGPRFTCGEGAPYTCDPRSLLDPPECKQLVGENCPNDCGGIDRGACVESACVCRDGFYGDACEYDSAEEFCTAIDRIPGISDVCVKVDFGACPPRLDVEYDSSEYSAGPEAQLEFGRLATRQHSCREVKMPGAQQCSVCVVERDVEISEPLISGNTLNGRRAVRGCLNVRVQCTDGLTVFHSLGCFGRSTDAFQPMTLPQCDIDVCGDGQCTGQESLTSCIADCGCTTALPNVDLSRVGDGYCDADFNVECCWDGGDCCAESCVPTTIACGTSPLAFEQCHSPTLECQVCLRNCNGHGTCNAAYECECAPGWRTQFASDPCNAPVCESCVAPGGTCVAPNSCECADGYCGAGCAQKTDRCDVCGGDDACVGCDGVPNSGKKVDACNVCGGTATECGQAGTSGSPDNVRTGDMPPLNDDGIGAGAVALIAIAAFLLACAFCGIILWYVMKRKRSYHRDVPEGDEGELEEYSRPSATKRTAQGGAKRQRNRQGSASRL